MHKVKINLFCEYFYPDIASTGQLMTELAIELVKKGFQVTAYTAKPSYVKKESAPRYQVYQGVKIKRIFNINANKNSYIGRALRNLSFILSAFIYGFFTRNNAFTIIISCPQMLGIVGVLLKMLRNKEFVFVFEDLFPDVPVKLGYMKEDSIITKVCNIIIKQTILKSKAIVVLSEDMKNLVLKKVEPQKMQEIEEKIEIIHNWADGQFIRPIPRKENKFVIENNLLNKFVIQYSGNLAPYNRFDTVLKASSSFTNQGVLFLFIGNGARRKEIEEFIFKNKPDNVKIMNYVPYPMVTYSMTSADVSIISLQKDLSGMNMPCRLYSIMASGKPVIGLIDNNCSIHKIINEAECGLRVDQDDVEGFVKAVRYYKDNPDIAQKHGANGRKYFENNFTLEIVSQQYYNLLEKYSK